MLGASAALAGAEDTIVAESTVPGRGALAIVRVSGKKAHEIARHLAATWPGQARHAVRSAIHDADGRQIDDAIVVRYDAPASFTGEDLVEITTHGGAIVPATVVAAIISAGARQAEAGEFTRRAVINGKVDLLQAEAVGDLTAATSRAAQDLALRQLDGGLSRRINDLRASILAVEAMIAYDIDFPEEDDGPIPRERIATALGEVERSLDGMLATSGFGEMVREGALVVLAGVPNAGKSSLFNALVGRQRAIVTDIPGTTRDAIEAVVDIGRWPIRLVDTAGLRETADLVEAMGVEVSRDYMSRAALVLACGATDSELDAARELSGQSPARTIEVLTKADLGTSAPRHSHAIAVSATTGAGLDTLASRITAALDAAHTPDADAPVLTRARHRERVATAREELKEFRSAWTTGAVPAVVAAVHLRSATSALEELIGRVDVEAVLDEVFARFCVGK
jgi:tRNA modification GTPase